MDKKILVVSGWGPPMIDGPSIILGNLLREFDRESTFFFSRKINKNNSVFNKQGNPLTIKSYSVYVPSPYTPGLESLRRIFRLMETAFIPLTAIKGIFVCIKEKVNCILATSDQPHIHFLTAAYYISKIMKKQLVLYLLDPVDEFSMGRVQKKLVNMLMPRLFKYASTVFVMSDVLADYYLHKYGVRCEVLPHAVDNLSGKPEVSVSYPEHKQETIIIFSGKISQYQEDSLLNLKKAIDILPNKIRLKIYASNQPDYIKKIGLSGNNISIDHVSHEQLKKELYRADILFLPLSFKHSESMIVKSAFPAKTMDYLLAGRPILIHAPKDSFIVDYARKNGFAVCVDNNDIYLLAESIRHLIEDKDLHIKLINNSKKTLLQHSSKTVYKNFSKALEDNLN